MPPDIQSEMMRELRSVMEKVTETMSKISLYSSSIDRIAEDRAAVQILKEKMTELKHAVDELYDLLQKDSNAPAVITRLSRIEGSLKEIDTTLKQLEASAKLLPDIQSKIHDFERDCNHCKESVEERLDALEEEKRLEKSKAEESVKDSEKERKEARRNFQTAIIAAVAPQILTWILLIFGYLYTVSQQATVAQNMMPDPPSKAAVK